MGVRVQGSERGAVGNALRGVPLAAIGLALAISATLIAQDVEPARFVAEADAQPIAAASDALSAPADAPLRWKSKQRVTAASQPTVAEQPISAEPPVRLGWNITRVDLSVKPVQALAPATGPSPFNDPFGDRQAGNSSTTLELQPITTESGVEELPPPRSMTQPRSVVSSPRAAGPQVSEERSASPPAEIFEIAQPAPSLPPPPTGSGSPARPTVPCDRIYNDRNCCATEESCTAFRNELLASSIRHISLDITPRFMPDKPAAEDEALRMDALDLLELRPWKSRTGEVLATGRMGNYEGGSVIVVDESGTEVARLPSHELGEDELCYLNAWWRLPAECALGGMQAVERRWIPSTFAWHASGLCHKPLYFEDAQLERYGHTTGPYSQPFVSGAHFFLNIAALPYNMAINPPQECVYALGYYRPGNCAPYMIPPIPLSLRGALAEAGVIVGGVYLIP